VPVSGVPSDGDPTPAAPGQAGAARAEPARDAGDAGGHRRRGQLARGREGTLDEQVREALAGLDEAELGAHPEAFEALSAAIVAELRSLEEL
jgi:hypothetical protein